MAFHFDTVIDVALDAAGILDHEALALRGAVSLLLGVQADGLLGLDSVAVGGVVPGRVLVQGIHDFALEFLVLLTDSIDVIYSFTVLKDVMINTRLVRQNLQLRGRSPPRAVGLPHTLHALLRRGLQLGYHRRFLQVDNVLLLWVIDLPADALNLLSFDLDE